RITCSTKPLWKIQKSSPGPGRYPCRCTAAWRRTSRYWNTSACSTFRNRNTATRSLWEESNERSECKPDRAQPSNPSNNETCTIAHRGREHPGGWKSAGGPRREGPEPDPGEMDARPHTGGASRHAGNVGTPRCSHGRGQRPQDTAQRVRDNRATLSNRVQHRRADFEGSV